jgi:serine protease AprX
MFRQFVFAIAITVASIGPGNVRSSAMPPPPAQLSQYVLAATEGGASASFLVVMREQADVSGAASLPTKTDKGAFVYQTLRQTALRSQRAIRAELDQLGIPYRPFYIVNMIEMEGGRDLVLKLAARPDIARIEANPQISNLQYLIPNTQYPVSHPQSPSTVEWNIQQVNAPAVWAMGYTGQGVVVAGQDTGYQWDHPALKPHYRGWNGVTVTHDYNWHDAIHTTAFGSCPNNSPVPCDAHGHGTHTMGTMVGDDGAGNQVGLAPGAQWIGCRDMDNYGNGTPASYTECFEFFLAPYPIGGSAITQGVPSLAPAVVSNSWSCPTSEGCSALTLQTVVDNVRAAGIEVVAAAQNYGLDCSTIREPIGTYASAFTVGATDSSDAIAGFSSRGPVTSDGSGRRKPDISAPGVSVRSAYPTNSWVTLSGTSMATPHVAGLFALVWSAAPGLMGNLAATEQIITSTVLHLTTTQGCGGDTSTSVPNNVYGWGRIDALAAVRAAADLQAAQPALQIEKTATAGPVMPGDPLSYTLTVTNPSSMSNHTNVVIADTLPVSVTFASASNGGIYSPTAHSVSWLVPTLAAQSRMTLTLAVTVGAPGSTVVLPPGTLLVNRDYHAQSDQVTRTVSGPPVTTTVGPLPYIYYIPIYIAPPAGSASVP